MSAGMQGNKYRNIIIMNAARKSVLSVEEFEYLVERKGDEGDIIKKFKGKKLISEHFVARGHMAKFVNNMDDAIEDAITNSYKKDDVVADAPNNLKVKKNSSLYQFIQDHATGIKRGLLLVAVLSGIAIATGVAYKHPLLLKKDVVKGATTTNVLPVSDISNEISKVEPVISDILTQVRVSPKIPTPRVNNVKNTNTRIVPAPLMVHPPIVMLDMHAIKQDNGVRNNIEKSWHVNKSIEDRLKAKANAAKKKKEHSE